MGAICLKNSSQRKQMVNNSNLLIESQIEMNKFIHQGLLSFGIWQMLHIDFLCKDEADKKMDITANCCTDCDILP
jgi:hypothetical protein